MPAACHLLLSCTLPTLHNMGGLFAFGKDGEDLLADPSIPMEPKAGSYQTQEFAAVKVCAIKLAPSYLCSSGRAPFPSKREQGSTEGRATNRSECKACVEASRQEWKLRCE